MTALKPWAVDTGIRAVKTFSQSLVALFGANAFDVLRVDWKVDLSVAAGAAIVSVLQNVQSITVAPQVVVAPVVAVAPAVDTAVVPPAV